MRYRLSRLALIATAALLWTGCASTRTLKSDVRSQMYEVTRDTVREEVALLVHDTLREVTTITIRQNEAGDTLKVTQITDRDRFRDRSQLRDKSEKLIVKTDTVYIEKRDSVQVTTTNLSNPTNKSSNFVRALKWIFAVICAVGVLVIVVKVKG